MTTTHELAKQMEEEEKRGQQPTHYLSAFERNNPSGIKGRVGSAWLKPNGSISIKLNPFVTLTSESGLTLWPANDRDRKREKAQQNEHDSDIPF